MKELQVSLGERSYPIFIGRDLLGASAPAWQSFVRGHQACIVSNDRVAPLYLDRVRAGLGDKQLAEVILPDGESHKTLEVASRVFDTLLEKNHNRSIFKTYVSLKSPRGRAIAKLTIFLTHADTEAWFSLS